MARTKYKFNPESLSFDRISLGVKALLLRFLAYFIGSLIIAVIYSIIFAFFVDSPKEKALIREIEQLTLQYELINKEMGDMEKILTNLQDTDDNLYRTIFEAEPIPASLREGGIGGVNRYETLEGYTNSDIVIETTQRLDKIRKKTYGQSKSFEELITLAINMETMGLSIPAIQPISNKDLTRTSSGFGLRIHPYYKITMFHNGMDFTAPTGTPIYSTGDGKVLSVRSSRTGLGNNIVIDHGFGYSSVYGHLQSFNVKVGQKVVRGDVIGFVGSTGMSVGPHIHYEVHLNGKAVDPANYFFIDLTAEEYERIVEIASRSGQSLD
jgi:murein DD-endopeptidase MepM/ murein hydrolase activator NlpD